MTADPPDVDVEQTIEDARVSLTEVAADLAIERHEYAVDAYDTVDCDGLDPVTREGHMETRVSCDSCGVVLLRVPDTSETDTEGRVTFDAE